ncbi:COMM domain-containing protein 5 [Euwallacea fornicatus]|uniref:COMM domain-containing protein 5 n=1 Tax=Euwallacea fornicatus TaxID=995702 RepID=UPI00338E9508
MNLVDISKSTINLVTNFPNEYNGRMVKLALASLQPSPQNVSKAIEKLSTEKNIAKEDLYEILSVYVEILRLFIHTSDKDFINNLLEWGFSNDFVEKLTFLNNRKELIDTFLAPHYGYFQNVSSIKWRIDISLLHSILGNKTLPNVVLIIKQKNEVSRTIELNAKAFHMLRFNVALILQEMKSLKLKTSLDKIIK